MYRSFLPMLAASVVCLSTFTACQKAQVDPNRQTETALVGRWQLVQTSGGVGGGSQPADPQQLRELVFGADGQAQRLLNGTPTATSTYTLAQAVAATSQRTETFIEYANPRMGGHPYIAEVSASTLVLNDDYFDGLSAKYQREMPILCGTR